MKYYITQEQVQKILNVLGEVPAKLSFEALLLVNEVVAKQQLEEKKED